MTRSFKEALASLRAAYLAEVERLAIELRPRFESGELRGFTEAEEAGQTKSSATLEELCGARFAKGITWEAAHLLLAVSPNGEATDDTWMDVRHHVRAAVSWDVLHIARTRGWYTPSPDESPAKVRGWRLRRAA